MVFATDFEPLDSSRRSSSAATNQQPSDAIAQAVRQAPLSPASQASQLAAAEKINTSMQASMQAVPVASAAEPAKRVREMPAAASAPLKLPNRPALPLGLQLLNRIQNASTVLTGVLMSGALLAYGSTVYVDRSTDQALHQLDALQSESQQLTTANESIKQSLAEQAIREDSGLELHEADDVLFLAPEAPRQVEVPEAVEPKPLRPLGY